MLFSEDSSLLIELVFSTLLKVASFEAIEIELIPLLESFKALVFSVGSFSDASPIELSSAKYD